MYLTACSWVLLKTFRVVQFCEDTLCRLWHTYIPICCSQQQITSRYSKSEECTKKRVFGKCACESGRQEIAESSYAIWSLYKACSSVRLAAAINVSCVPCNTTKPTADGRTVGGTAEPIEHQPLQLKLLNCCWIEPLFWCIET